MTREKAEALVELIDGLACIRGEQATGKIDHQNCLEAVKILSALTDKLVEVQTKEIRNGNGTYRSSPS